MIRSKTADCPEFEECLIQWIKQCRDRNVPVSGPVIKEKPFALQQCWMGSKKGATLHSRRPVVEARQLTLEEIPEK